MGNASVWKFLGELPVGTVQLLGAPCTEGLRGEESTGEPGAGSPSSSAVPSTSSVDKAYCHVSRQERSVPVSQQEQLQEGLELKYDSFYTLYNLLRINVMTILVT